MLRDLGGRLVALERHDGHFSLQPGWVSLARSGHCLSFLFNAANHLED
jgi:hypothetical protein